ncbi:MAG: flagellar hook-basal body complex protein FliE [Nocardioidaceae bacterium]
MTVPAIGAAGFVPMTPTTLTQPPAGPTGSTSAGATGATGSADFGQLLGQGLQQLQGLQSNADNLAVQAATGNLANIHDYTVAATEASVATQLTVAVRNKALEAFNSIMQMPV